MAAKEDILEQIVEEFLLHHGYFVRHNIKFLPRRDHPDYFSNQDSNHSDIDVLALHPKKIGVERVWAVSCKSWQGGFRPEAKVAEIMTGKMVAGREAWKGFRELVRPKWSEAFVDAIERETGQREFTYVTAVTKIHGAKEVWENNSQFRNAIGNNPIKLISLSEMIGEVSQSLNTTLANTELGRMLQLLKAAGLKF